MKETFYFSHDYNARTDHKIKNLMRKHGVVGYGLFWMFIEDLYNNANALPTDYEGIAYEYRVDESLVRSLINDFGFFEIKNGYFGSISVQKRIEERDAKSEKARKSAFARWEKSDEEPKEDANAMQTQSDSNAIKNSIGENSIDKKGKIDFEIVWDLYDKKKGDKDKLKIKWDKLSFSVQQLIIEHIPKYKIEQPDKLFRKNFEAYLNQKAWHDEIITGGKTDEAPQKIKLGKQNNSLSDEELAKYASI